MVANESQIVGNNAPTHPSLEATFALVEAAVQSKDAFEYRNAPFDPSMPFAAPPEPALLFMHLPLERFFYRVWAAPLV